MEVFHPLAIIIPAYKHQFLRETLDSLVKQTCKDFNLYIGDDASPNPIGEIVEEFRGKLDFVYKRFDENLGGISLVGHWKRCIEMTRGENWLMILGDDDILPANLVETFSRNFDNIENEKINVIRFSSVIIDGFGNKTSEIFLHPVVEDSRDSFFRTRLGDSRSSLSEYVFQRSAYEKVKFKDYPLGWHSDDMAWLEFSNFGKVFTINEAVVQIRVSSENIGGSTYFDQLKARANFCFYKDLNVRHLKKFSKDQARTLVERLEYLAFTQKKLSLKTWRILFFGFLSYYPFPRLIKFNWNFAGKKTKKIFNSFS